MNSRWFRKCRSEEERKELRARLLTNKDLLDNLASMLQEDFEINLKTLEKMDKDMTQDVIGLSLHLAAERKTIRRLLEILKVSEE